MTHWKKAFKSDYLSSSDIEGKDLVLTIKHVKYQECTTASGKTFCNVAHFTDSSFKPMILNVVNSQMVKKFAGNNTQIETYNNIKVQIYVDPRVQYRGGLVEGLRIRENQPKTNTKKTPLSEDKYDAAVKFLKNGKTMDELKAFYSFDKETEDKLKLDSNE